MKLIHRLILAILLLAIACWLGIAIHSSHEASSQATVTSPHTHGEGCKHSSCSHGFGHLLDPELLERNEAKTRQRLYTELPKGIEGRKLIKSRGGESDWEGQSGGAFRAHQITPSADFMNGKPFQQGEVLTLNLFDDVRLNTVVQESFTNINGTVSTTTRVDGTTFGRAVMAYTGDELRVKLILPESNEIYEIQYNHTDGSHYVMQMDPSIVDTIECGTVEGSMYANPPEAAGDMPSTSNITNAQAASIDENVALVVIDTMIVYPENVLTSAGSLANVENIAAQGVALTNDAYINTDAGIYMNLVHTALLSGYSDTGSQGTDLNRITNTADGHIDDVHTWRDNYGVDFVQMMHSVSGGLAWTPSFSGASSGRADLAFSITGWDSFASYTPAHEVGHNMCLQHAKGQDISPGTPDSTVGTDAAGWHWHPGGDGTQDGFCSVLTYSGNSFSGEGSHVRVGLFSDPNIVNNGQPAGDVDDGNNARVLRAYKNIYANYRTLSLPANSILAESPNGGELLIAGKVMPIEWNHDSVSGNVKIELYNGGVLEREITASTLNDRVFIYTMPTDLPSSNQYRLRISSVDNPNIHDFSDADFTITEAIYSTDLDTDPGFTISGGGWAYGAPSGDNPNFGGPYGAYTGTNIYDTNLTGASFGNHYLTTPAIDCSAYQGVTLTFAGQFSVATGYEANVEVSNDGSTWTEVSSVTDVFNTAWTVNTHDISSVADGQSTVYVRWVHLDVSGSGNFSGMAVDDISISGYPATTPFGLWSEGLATSTDSNGDGLSNSLAWVLGSPSPSDNALTLNPAFDNNSDATYFIFTHRRNDYANNDSNTTIAVEYSSDLTNWSSATHDGTNIIVSESDDFYAPFIDKVEVKVNRGLASGGRLFTRLNVATSE